MKSGDPESPFLYHELLVQAPDEAWEPRAAALVAESPFVDALPEGRAWSAEGEVEELAEEEGAETDEWEREPEETSPSQGDTFELDSQEEADGPTDDDESEPQASWEELEDTNQSHEEEEEDSAGSPAAEALDEL